jgi:outer membrane protein assembly factor BamB
MRRTSLVACSSLLLVVVTASAAFGASWTQYQFDGSHTGNPPETILSPSNVDDLVYDFGVVVGGAATGVSQPIVVHNVGYAGVSAPSATEAGSVAAFKASTGAAIWTTHVCGEGSVSMPAFASGRVWVQAGDGALSGFDAGNGVLRVCVKGAASSAFNSPCAAGRIIYTADEVGGIRAVDASTGQIRWDQTAAQPLTTPACGKSFVYTSTVSAGVTQPGVVYKFRAADGSLVWKKKIGVFCCSTVAVAGGRVFVSAEQSVVALDAGTGAVDWHTNGIGQPSAPSIAGDQVFVGTSADPGLGGGAASLDAATGAIVWHRNDTGPISAPITVANGVIYGIGQNQGPLFMYSMANGDVLAVRVSPTDPQGIYSTAQGVTVLNGIVYATDANADVIDAWSL